MVCAAATRGGDFCDDHLEFAGDRWARIYQDPRWRRTRDQARKLAQGRCTSCGVRGQQLQADHVRPLVDGGQPFDVANVVMLCVDCHGRKTAADRARRAAGGQLVCVECGNDDAAAGYGLCTDCLQLLWP